MKHAPMANYGKKDDDLTILRLIRSRRVGASTYHRLLAEHGSAHNALAALPEIAAGAGVDDYSPCSEAQAVAELAAGRRANATLIRHDSPLYPQALREIDDAPPVLWVIGDPAWLSHNPVAVIGARNASSLGLRMARGMVTGLSAAGHTIVAGLARGVDTAAHNTALPTGTVAVLAGGVDVIYPSENNALAAEIARKGALISEQPPGAPPAARHFPTRNRIISGLSRAVVVIEAAHRSGTLITARNALDQGRDVMAVPGHPMDSRASGCNMLIRDGALLVRSAADVIEAMALQEPARVDSVTGKFPAWEAEAPPAAIPANDNTSLPGDLEARILSQLSPSPSIENDLIRDLGLPVAPVNAAIQSLELQGRVTRLAGGLLAAS